MNRLFAACITAALLTFSGAAMAFHCQADMKKIDEAFQKIRN